MQREGIIDRKCRIIQSAAIVQTIGFAKSQPLVVSNFLFARDYWLRTKGHGWRSGSSHFFDNRPVSLCFTSSSSDFCDPRNSSARNLPSIDFPSCRYSMPKKRRRRRDRIRRRCSLQLWWTGNCLVVINDCFRQGETQTHYVDGGEEYAKTTVDRSIRRTPGVHLLLFLFVLLPFLPIRGFLLQNKTKGERWSLI